MDFYRHYHSVRYAHRDPDDPGGHTYYTNSAERHWHINILGHAFAHKHPHDYTYGRTNRDFYTERRDP